VGRPDDVVAAEALANHTRCNNSFIYTLFQALYRSSLTCPGCHHHSNTFDPFLSLSLPIPHHDCHVVNVVVVHSSEEIPGRQLEIPSHAEIPGGQSEIHGQSEIPSHAEIPGGQSEIHGQSEIPSHAEIPGAQSKIPAIKPRSVMMSFATDADDSVFDLRRMIADGVDIARESVSSGDVTSALFSLYEFK